MPPFGRVTQLYAGTGQRRSLRLWPVAAEPLTHPLRALLSWPVVGGPLDILGDRAPGGCGAPRANTVKALYRGLSKHRIRISSSHLGHSQKSHGCFIPLRGLRHRPGLGPCRRVLLCHRGVWEFAIESAMAMGSTTAHRIEPAHDAQAPASFPCSWLPSDPWRPLVAPVEPDTPPLPTAPKGA